MAKLPFKDRTEAGQLLGMELASRELPADTVVLALPRGGVPVGAAVARALKAPLDVLVVRKLGVPWQPELAMGAIAGASRVLDTARIRDLHISNAQVEQVIARETPEVARREALYRNGLPPHDLRGRTVVLVDDGLATGATMAAAAKLVHTLHPRAVIVAVPVASWQAGGRLRGEANQVVCLATPDPFLAVGEWYADFRQVTDEEVREILQRAQMVHQPAG